MHPTIGQLLKTILLTVTFSLICNTAYAQRVSDLSELISPVVGSVDAKSGITVVSVETREDGTSTVTLSMAHEDHVVEEVIVVGDKNAVDLFSGSAPKTDYELINDPETGRHGLVFTVGKQKNFQIRFNYAQGGDNFPPPPRSGPAP